MRDQSQLAGWNVPQGFFIGVKMPNLNPRFKQAYAISKRIPRAKNKRLAILAWCQAVKKAIG